jgi:large subunit ribosomal protein L30e
MAKREKAVDKNIEEIKKLMKSSKIIIGTKQVQKLLRENRLAKVFLSVNCRKDTSETVLAHAKITGAEVIQLKYPNDELGVLCKKPFSISLIGIVR